MDDDFIPDKIVIGGPSNSTIVHGPQSHRGFGSEAVWRMEAGGRGGRVGDRIVCEYHLTEPVKISLLERSRLAKEVDDLVSYIELNLPTAKVLYMEMFPRFMERCCRKERHMREDDSWVLDNNRRETEREIRMKNEADVRWCSGSSRLGLIRNRR